MICRYCGNEIDDNATMCPHCGSSYTPYVPQQEYVDDVAYDESGDVYDDADMGGYEDVQDYAPPKKKKGGVSFSGIPVSTIISLASAVFSFICLVTVSSIKGNISDSTKSVMNGLNQVQSSISAIDERISGLDSTVANVQKDAYNQLASQTISITKDVLSLTGPVTQNKTAIMFTVKAKGSLNVNTSFTWQKYNETTSGWTDIVFTGAATSNEEFGLRLENKAPVDGEYESILWANGITSAAAGTYRCMIKDTNGITKTSSEAVVQITADGTT